MEEIEVIKELPSQMARLPKVLNVRPLRRGIFVVVVVNENNRLWRKLHFYLKEIYERAC